MSDQIALYVLGVSDTLFIQGSTHLGTILELVSLRKCLAMPKVNDDQVTNFLRISVIVSNTTKMVTFFS